MSNYSTEMHSDRTAILLCQNQMPLMQTIRIQKGNLHKSLQLMKGYESMSDWSNKMHSLSWIIRLITTHMFHAGVIEDISHRD
jgi:hypothetical protein